MIVAKQPNGLFCVFTNGSVNKYNLTEEEFYQLALEEIKENFHTEGYVYSIDFLIQRIDDDEILAKMGFNKSHEELLKFIPRRVVGTSYASHDCTTYGHCPTCNAIVENGYYRSDDKCRKCGQILEW